MGGGVYIKKVYNKLDSKMWITFWKKAWKYGFFVLSLLCKLMRDMKEMFAEIKDMWKNDPKEVIGSTLFIIGGGTLFYFLMLIVGE